MDSRRPVQGSHRHLHGEPCAGAAPAPVPDKPPVPEPWLDPSQWSSGRVRQRLVQLVGVGGFRALMVHAVALAREEHEWLRELHVAEDGCLISASPAQPACTLTQRKAGSLAIRRYFRALSCRFLGGSLVERIIRDAWPEPPLADTGDAAMGQEEAEPQLRAA